MLYIPHGSITRSLEGRGCYNMASSDRIFSYLETCSGPLIFMGDDSPQRCEVGLELIYTMDAFMMYFMFQIFH
jgi:hypothetical protein